MHQAYACQLFTMSVWHSGKCSPRLRWHHWQDDAADRRQLLHTAADITTHVFREMVAAHEELVTDLAFVFLLARVSAMVARQFVGPCKLLGAAFPRTQKRLLT